MPSLDPATLAELRELQAGSPGLLAELIDLFLRDSAQHVKTIRATLDAKDPHGLERAAHTLKGASGSLGAKALSKLCSELQVTARSADWTKLAPLVAAVEKEHAAAAAELLVEKTR